VWKSWTDAALLSRWYGPGCETIIHKLDVAAGGLWLLEMKMGARSMYQRVEYTEVAAPERLVWLHSMADADWNIISAPHQPDWPRVLLTNVTFEEAAGKTTVRLTWVPHQASDAEIACFRDALSSMNKGWNMGMKLLGREWRPTRAARRASFLHRTVCRGLEGSTGVQTSDFTTWMLRRTLPSGLVIEIVTRWTRPSGS
jgi:uncharacterized protein YndB with AHSA1/START domain